AAGTPIRAVDDAGAVKYTGEAEQMVNDIYLRGEFPAAGKARSHRPGDTPTDRYDNAVSALALAMTALTDAYHALERVVGDDGRPLVETRGVDQRSCAAWRTDLSDLSDGLVLWSATHRRANAAAAARVVDDDFVDEVSDEVTVTEQWE